jgi:phosphohistidine phosphatase
MGTAVYVMRHGRAESGAGCADEDRRLSPDGQRGMALLGQGLAKLGITFDAIVSSPLVRAWQTAEAVQLATSPHVQIEQASCLGPDTQPLATLHTVLQKLDRPCHHVLIVGHNPGISALLRVLVVGQEGAGFLFDPATMARVDFGSTLQPGGGTLRWMMSAEQMEKLGGG